MPHRFRPHFFRFLPPFFLSFFLWFLCSSSLIRLILLSCSIFSGSGGGGGGTLRLVIYEGVWGEVGISIRGISFVSKCTDVPGAGSANDLEICEAMSLIPALVLLMRSLCAFSSFDFVPGTNCCLAIDATEAILPGCFHGSSGGALGDSLVTLSHSSLPHLPQDSLPHLPQASQLENLFSRSPSGRLWLIQPESSFFTSRVSRIPGD